MIKKYYQKEWHNIKFKDFIDVTPKKLADSNFYHLFYKEFFRRYNGYDDLDSKWLEHKKFIAEYILNNYNLINKSVLSIGTGIGYIELNLINNGVSNIYIHEVSKEPLKWISKYVLNDRIFIGFIPTCLNIELKYDFVYLIGIDYCFNDIELLKLIKSVKNILNKDGKCLLISYIYEMPKSFIYEIYDTIKYLRSNILYDINIFNRKNIKQFYGYIQSHNKLVYFMKKLGFNNIKYKVLKTKTTFDVLTIEAENI